MLLHSEFKQGFPMNAVYRVVFNAVSGVWQVVSETARGQSKSRRHALHIVAPLVMLFGLANSSQAQPTCSLATSCTFHGSYTSPSGVSALSMGNGSAQNLTFVHASDPDNSWLTGGGMSQSGSSISTFSGAALEVNAGAGGSVNITNESGGTVSVATINQPGTLGDNDPISVAIYGGAPVNMVNHGWIAGRIGLQASVAGNTFTNSNVIYGSVSLGAGGGANRFNAITGSTVPTLGQSSTAPTYLTDNTRPGLTFVAPGFVDGGQGGTNILALQNTINGTAVSNNIGYVDAANYINFANLLVEGGEWAVKGPLLQGNVPSSTQLLGGSVHIDDNEVFGDGRVTFDGGALTASVPITLENAFSVVSTGTIHNDSTMTLSGVVSGSGKLTKTGTGTLSLTGINDFSGIAEISAGTLAASVESLGTSSIINNAAWSLNQPSDAIYAQSISGSGTITKTGAGKLTLTGDSSAFAGTSTFQAGALHLTSTGSLGGALNMASGTTLSGTGSVGRLGRSTTLRSGATVAPGDASAPYGTLRVAGNMVFEPGAVFQVQTDPNSTASSRVDVAGTATLNGRVHHVATAGTYASTRDYTILSASGGTNSSFTSVDSDFAYLDATLVQPNANDVVLRLTRRQTTQPPAPAPAPAPDMEFAELAQTPNQTATANGVESLPSNNSLYQFVESLPKTAPTAVFDNLSGDVHSSLASSLVSLSAYAPRISSQHLLRNLNPEFCLEPTTKVETPQSDSPCSMYTFFPAWVEVLGQWQRYDGDGNAASMKQRTSGIFLGMDNELGNSGWRLGGAIGFTHTRGEVPARQAESNINSYNATVYGGKSFGPGMGPRINVLGGLALTWHDIETDRHIIGLKQDLAADYSAHAAQLFAEIGYIIGKYKSFRFEPFAGVSLGQQRVQGFHESGGSAALHGKSRTDNLANTTLGIRLNTDFQVGNKDGRLRTSLGWRHAMGDISPSKSMAFADGQNFMVNGVPQARNSALVEVEANIETNTGQVLVLGYQGEFGGGQRNHSAHVKVRWAF